MEVQVLSKIIYRGKEVTYEELKPTSQIRLKIQCPTCKAVYETRKQYLEEKGTTECQKCSMIRQFSKPLLPGEVHNYWTVLERVSSSRYQCRCKCGTVKEIEGTVIRNGYSKSCGCLKREAKKLKQQETTIDPDEFLKNDSNIDLVKPIKFRNQYIKYDDLKPKSNLAVRIRCSNCKSEFTTSKYRITSNGHSMCQSCAITERFSKHLATGDKYNRWTVIDGCVKRGYATCKCDCGTIRDVDNYALTSGASKSCGCLNSEIARERATETFKEIWKANKGVDIESDPRQTKGHEIWREFILARDNFQCVRCGSESKLNGHHIIAIKKDPSLALSPSNGIMLCVGCHRELHRRYSISADRLITESFIREVNPEFNLDEQTNKYPDMGNVSKRVRKAYKLDELIR